MQAPPVASIGTPGTCADPWVRPAHPCKRLRPPQAPAVASGLTGLVRSPEDLPLPDLPAPSVPTVTLTQFLREHAVGIVADLPVADGPPAHESLAWLLVAIAGAMPAGGTETTATPHLLEAAAALGNEHVARHAGSAARNDPQLGRLVDEVAALRLAVHRAWPGDGAGERAQLERFDATLDHALAVAVRVYVRQLDYSRNLFLAILGHDLRNPLGAIRLAAQSMLVVPGLPLAAQAALAQVLRSNANMIGLVNDFLDFARCRLGGGMPLTRAACDVGRVCREVVDELQAASERPVLVSLQGDLRGEWDRRRLAQMFGNLIGNALQHGARDRPVDVEADGGDGAVVVRIHNDGAPIPAEALASLFDPLVRFGAQAQEASPSLGLGLYIAREVAQAHGGSLDVESANRTSFTVRLPR